MIPTVPVTVTASDQSGNPVAGARVVATLDQTEIYQGFVAPEKVEAFADANGVAVLNLWPNALGVAGSRYRLRVINPDNGCMFLDVLAAVPNSACNLHEILVQEPYPPIDAAEQALIAAQAALADVTAQAVIASTAATDAQASETAAAASETQTGLDAAAAAADRVQTGLDRIATAADRAQTSADRAQTALDAAATAADRIATAADALAAAGAASTATTQAGIATTQASAAAASASTATTQASSASASASTAATQASAASASASTASTQAGIATTQAGIATTAASNASASETAAAASAAEAAGYVVPPLSGNAGKLLAVNGLATATEWVPTPESGGFEVANWAALLALTGVPGGRVYTVMAPLITGGAPGTMWKRDSTSLSGWRPAGRQVIWSSTTIVSGTTGGSTTEEINRQWLVPGGVFRGCARVHFMVRGTYNAADAATRTVRMLQGTAGTTSDAVIASATNAANSRQHTYSFLWAPVSSTTIRHAAGNNFASPLSTEVILSGSTPAPADATVSSLDSDHYWTLTHQSGASPTATYSTEFVYLEVA